MQHDPTTALRQRLRESLDNFLPPATPEEDSRLLRDLLRLLEWKDRLIVELESTLREIESEFLGVRGDVIRLMEEVAAHRNAAAEHAKLVAYYNTDEGYHHFGAEGDYYNRTPAETAIHAMRQLIEIKSKEGA